ncbi:MAG TPA: hypothetical protein VE957_23050 [Terriglobales bacterium]|nr:hypothetical protein [Terriglobales bacterium]
MRMTSYRLMLAAAVLAWDFARPPPAVAIVKTDKPVQEGEIVGNIPSLNVQGTTFPAKQFKIDPTTIHEGSFTNGLDLLGPWWLIPNQTDATSGCGAGAQSFPIDGTINEIPFLQHVCSTSHTCFTTRGSATPALSADLKNAIDDANAELTNLNADILVGPNGALTLLQDLGALTESTKREPRFVVFSNNDPGGNANFLPEFGRWLRAFSPFGGVVPIFGGGTTTFADPIVMANLRERGARLYCAAREAQKMQTPSTKSMGKLVPFSINLFGQEIDFLTIEPTLVIDGPQPYLDPNFPRCPVDGQNCATASLQNDGAQAFMVPFLVGTQITPISLLPSLPEIRVPVVMVTGDSEVLTLAKFPGPPGGPGVGQRTYQTVTHADAILSAELTGGASDSIPLFSIGPLMFLVNIGVGFGVGQLFSDEQIGYPSPLDTEPPPAPCMCPLQQGDIPPDTPQLADQCPPTNDRVLAAIVSSLWPSPIRDGDLQNFPQAGVWDEGAWAPALDTANTSLSNTVEILPFASFESFNLQPFDPMLIRGLEDDDRKVWVSTTLGLSAQLVGKLPPVNVSLPLGGAIHLRFAAQGGLTGDVAMRHALRDAALGVDQPNVVNPISAVSIEPSVNAKANADVEVDLVITIDTGLLGFGTLTIIDATPPNNPLINFNQTLAHYDSGPFDESHRFRLGTGAGLSFGDPLKAPQVQSHFPFDTKNSKTALFESFPPGNDVDSCLASSAPNPSAPPPCPERPPLVANPPGGQLCLYAGPPAGSDLPLLPGDVCANVVGYVQLVLATATAAQQQCVIDKFDFLCQPTSREQSFHPTNVVAHILDPTDTNALITIGNITDECLNAYVPGFNPQQVAGGLFGVALCDNQADLLDQDQVISSGTLLPTQAPPVQAGSCM